MASNKTLRLFGWKPSKVNPSCWVDPTCGCIYSRYQAMNIVKARKGKNKPAEYYEMQLDGTPNPIGLPQGAIPVDSMLADVDPDKFYGEVESPTEEQK